MKTKKLIFHRAFIFACIFILSTLLTSCSRNIIVWSVKDIVGLFVIGAIIAVIGFVTLFNWIKDQIKRISKTGLKKNN